MRREITTIETKKPHDDNRVSKNVTRAGEEQRPKELAPVYATQKKEHKNEIKNCATKILDLRYFSTKRIRDTCSTVHYPRKNTSKNAHQGELLVTATTKFGRKKRK